MRKSIQNFGIFLIGVIAFAFVAIYLMHLDGIDNRTGSSGSNFVSEEAFNVVDPPNPLPECNIEYGESSQNDLKILVQDDGDGIYQINILRSDNVKVDIPEFNTDVDNLAPKIVPVIVTKIDKSKASRVALEAFDLSLGRTECDSGDF